MAEGGWGTGYAKNTGGVGNITGAGSTRSGGVREICGFTGCKIGRMTWTNFTPRIENNWKSEQDTFL